MRLQNRGAVPGDVKVSVYWAEPSTFANPSSWHLVRTKMVYNVQPGSVSFGEIIWPEDALPPLGHFCPVCERDHPIDPAPDKTLITSGTLYSKFISESNNFAWKNINVVDVLPEGLIDMEFFIGGNANEYSEVRFELEKLPKDTEVYVRILRRLAEGAELIEMQFEKVNTRYSYYKLTPGRVCYMRGIPFQNQDKSEIVLYLKIPSKSKEVHKKGCKWINKMSKANMVGFPTLSHAHMLDTIIVISV